MIRSSFAYVINVSVAATFVVVAAETIEGKTDVVIDLIHVELSEIGRAHV